MHSVLTARAAFFIPGSRRPRQGIRRVITLYRRYFSVYRPLRTGKLEIAP
ncbi:MAG: hypothetical protein IT186_12485 [Acidobacteria bacterium]|nr:hypothetical protein [Acidobacteriota bacterium]